MRAEGLKKYFPNHHIWVSPGTTKSRGAAIAMAPGIGVQFPVSMVERDRNSLYVGIDFEKEGEKYRIGTYYRHPNMPAVDLVQMMSDHLSDERWNIIGGDFNVDPLEKGWVGIQKLFDK